MWGSHSSGYEEFCLQECHTVQCIRETMTYFHWTTWCYVPEDRLIHYTSLTILWTGCKTFRVEIHQFLMKDSLHKTLLKLDFPSSRLAIILQKQLLRTECEKDWEDSNKGEPSYSLNGTFPESHKTERVKSLQSKPNHICIGGTDKPVKHWKHIWIWIQTDEYTQSCLSTYQERILQVETDLMQYYASGIQTPIQTVLQNVKIGRGQISKNPTHFSKRTQRCLSYINYSFG
jgi:hypothetical protein